MRELLYFELVHQGLETGLDEEISKYPGYASLSEKDRKNTLDKMEQIYNEIWQEFNEELESLDFGAYSAVRVYQDGVLRVPKERIANITNRSENYQNPPFSIKRIRKLSTEGARNAKAVCSLMDKGAILEGTENPVWLILHCYYKELPVILYRIPLLSEILLDPIENLIFRKRDKFIAHTIDKTLKEGDLGILFMGMDHMVDSYLPKDIEIQFYELIEENTFDELLELYTHLAGKD